MQQIFSKAGRVEKITYCSNAGTIGKYAVAFLITVPLFIAYFYYLVFLLLPVRFHVSIRKRVEIDKIFSLQCVRILLGTWEGVILGIY